ncbi:hypothetical protein LdCL_310024900 [Leishmania donovani]|uniref:Uncharacterized protein n=1 Tax=Leishmania donovani TaxID=5661 RepID=A0A3S7X4K2_LEIDO|nr:hypothetical protein LdCL_310024900 [Leishmania donovani]
MIVKDVSVAALAAVVEVSYLEPTGSTTFTSPRSSPYPTFSPRATYRGLPAWATVHIMICGIVLVFTCLSYLFDPC